MNFLIIIIGKFIASISKILKIGSGGTWPGEIAINLNPDILKYFSSALKGGFILVAGTNGKTTTTLMIKKILERGGFKVISNATGANLINGVVSSFIQNSSWFGQVDADYGVFEIDENTLPIVIKFIKFLKLKVIIVFLNLFRDQLDRYGEVDVVAQKWGKVLRDLPKKTKIILNADDPQIAFLGEGTEGEVIYFGLDDPKLFLKEKEHATDSIFCLYCGSRLNYKGIYYSHIGIWICEKCGWKRPKPNLSVWKSPLPGLYNQYNTLAAVSAAKSLGISDSQIRKTLAGFSPAFGRQEEFEVKGTKVKIFLSKNPAGFNETLRTVINMGARRLLFILNDRIPDGKDVSWIWDVDFEMLPAYVTPVVSGDRAYDMGLRIKYAFKSQNSKIKAPAFAKASAGKQNCNSKVKIYEKLNEVIKESLKDIKQRETLYILATYSAMLEARKVLKGRKIL